MGTLPGALTGHTYRAHSPGRLNYRAHSPGKLPSTLTGHTQRAYSQSQTRSPGTFTGHTQGHYPLADTVGWLARIGLSAGPVGELMGDAYGSQEVEK